MKSSTVILALALFGTSASAADPSDLTAEQRMFADALALERQGKGPEAVKAYMRAAKAGSGKAARRLAEIYDQGIPGVNRDHAESLKWEAAARKLGDDVALSDEERRKREAERRAGDAQRRAEEQARLEREGREPRFYKEPLRIQPQTESLFSQGEMLERQNRGPEAVKMYARAARDGSGKAARRLAEIYDKGIPGVARDYSLALRWYNAARVLGEDVPPAKR